MRAQSGASRFILSAVALISSGVAVSIGAGSHALANGNQEDCRGNSSSLAGTHIVDCGIFNESGGNATSSAISLFGLENTVRSVGGTFLTGIGNQNNLGVGGGPYMSGATAIGSRNTAIGDYSTAVGFTNDAYGRATTAVGFSNHVGNVDDPTVSVHSSAFGSNNIVTGPAGATTSGTDASLSLGESNRVYGNQNVAIGNRSRIGDVGKFYSGSYVAGYQATVFGDQSMAMGYNAAVGDELTAAHYSMAIGGYATATGSNALALGSVATASAQSAVAIGLNASALQKDAIALGAGASATSLGSVAIGAGALADSRFSVALGDGSLAQGVHTGATSINGGTVAGLASADHGVVSIGGAGRERQLQNVAAGVISATSTDAVNGSQLFAVGSAVNTLSGNVITLGASTAAALGGGSSYATGTGVTAPSYVVQNVAYQNVGAAIGALQAGIASNNIFFAAQGSAVGGALATGIDSTASGNTALASGDHSAAMGSGATATGHQSTALGAGTTARSSGATAVGYNATAGGTNAAAYGRGAVAGGENSVAIGSGAAASRDNQFSLGTGSNTYTAAGITSAESRAAQSGITKFVTTDANGNLASSTFGPNDIAELKKSIQRGYEGTAVALATAGGNFLQANQKYSLTGKVGTFRGQYAFGVVAQARLSDNIVAHAGIGGGFRHGGVGAYGGLTIGW